MLDNDINELSDAELEAAFKAAKAEAGAPVTIEDTLVDDVDDNDEVDELEQPDDVDSDDDTSAKKEDEREDEDD